MFNIQQLIEIRRKINYIDNKHKNIFSKTVIFNLIDVILLSIVMVFSKKDSKNVLLIGYVITSLYLKCLYGLYLMFIP
jgi:hypothetical protein